MLYQGIFHQIREETSETDVQVQSEWLGYAT